MLSEGYVYDLVNKQVKNQDRLTTFNQITNRKERFKVRYED